MKLSKMCTSVAIGFYIRNEEAFIDFKSIIMKMSRENNSIFSVYEKKPLSHTADIPTGEVHKIKIQNGNGHIEDDFCVI